MESFTISVDLTDKVCTIKGTKIGLSFLDQQADITDKFILFCSEKYGIDSNIKWIVCSGDLEEEVVLQNDDIQLPFYLTNTLESVPETEHVNVNNKTGVNCNLRKRKPKYRPQKFKKSETESKSECEQKFEIESSELVNDAEDSDNENEKVGSVKNSDERIDIRSPTWTVKDLTKKMQLRDKGLNNIKGSVCNESNSNNISHQHYIKRTHKTHTFCELCHSVCYSESEYKEHILECKNKVDFKKQLFCTKCGECFKNKKELTCHVKEQHKTSFLCEKCKKVFFERKDFKHHLESTECVFTCSHCSLKFSTKEDLEEHRKEHLQCEKCGKNFKFKVLLHQHMATHSSERPFQCETCGLCFKLRSTLNLHKRTHFITNCFKCTSCDRQFKSADGIKNHKIKYHMTQEELATYKNKIYTCEHCGKMTGQKHVHIRHVRSHTGEKPYNCSDCIKSFPTHSALNIHRKKHSGKMETCDICKLNFLEYSKYTRHLKSKKHKALAARLKSLTGTSSLQDSVTEVPGQNSVVVFNDDTENGTNKTSSTYIILPDNFQNIQVGNLEILHNELEAVYTVEGDSVIVQTEENELS